MSRRSTASARREAVTPLPPALPRGRLLRFQGPSGHGERGLPEGALVLMGVWLAMVPTLMLFLSLVSAYVVRQGLGSDWVGVPMPPVLWVNTAVLLASGITVEIARRRGRRRQPTAVWLWLTLAMGLAFVGGQLLAWRQLLADGVGLATTPYASFFYLLSGTHALHLGLGILALLVAALWPPHGWRQVTKTTTVRGAAVCWHFLGVLWIGLFSLLVFWS